MSEHKRIDSNRRRRPSGMFTWPVTSSHRGSALLSCAYSGTLYIESAFERPTHDQTLGAYQTDVEGKQAPKVKFWRPSAIHFVPKFVWLFHRVRSFNSPFGSHSSSPKLFSFSRYFANVDSDLVPCRPSGRWSLSVTRALPLLLVLLHPFLLHHWGLSISSGAVSKVIRSP